MQEIDFLSLVLGVLAACLSLVVLMNNAKAVANRVYFALTLCGAVWLTANAISVHPETEVDVFFLRLITPASIMGVALFYYFSIYFPRLERQVSWNSPFIVVPALVVSSLAFSDLNLTTIKVDGQVEVFLGPLYPIYLLLMLSYAAFAIYVLSWKLSHSSGIYRVQLKYIAVGIAATLIPALIVGAIMPALGNEALSNYAPYFSSFFIFLTATAIIKHRLFDVRILVARSVTYVLLLVSLAALYVGGTFAVSSAFFSSRQPASVDFVYVLLALLVAFTFQPLKKLFERVSNSLLYREKYDSQMVLMEFGHVLVSQYKLDDLMRHATKKITKDLAIASGQLVVYSKGSIYKVSSIGVVPHKEFYPSSSLVLRSNMAIVDELPNGRLRTQMQANGERIVVRLKTRHQFVGYLSLGDKLNGDIFTSQDIELLEIMGNELAVALMNALAYEEIAGFNQTLQEKVEVATKRLREANSHLKELDKAKDEFISMASHQLRTPLTTIKGYLSMLEEGDVGKLSKDQMQFVHTAYLGSQRMVGLISDLLNVSRMSAGKFQIERSPVDLNRVVAEEVDSLQHHAQAKGLQLKFLAPDKPLPLIEIDENKTRQVLMNFIDNAVYYTKEGSITVALRQVGNKAEVRVTDTGIGVPQEAQGKLFSKFYRATNAQNVRPDGTGLGLFLARRVVEDQGGTIIFESEEGRGSTFGFALPLANKGTNAARTTNRQPAGAAK